jgi:D-3-phosphoglycerate dehydrogenase
MPHVLVAGRIHEAGIALLKTAPGVTFEVVDAISLESYAPLMPGADALVIRTQPLSAAVVAAAPRLKIVSRHGVGYDAVDVAALNRRAIPLAVVGDVNSRAVAEHTMMLMLASARRTVAHDGATRRGDWHVRNRFESSELDGKTLLLFGFGRIGRRVAELARAFGMAVLAHDPIVGAAAMIALGVEPAGDPGEALGRADFVSLHVPLSPAGAVIGAAELARMKPSAILINTARGGLIDEAALLGALNGGRPAHAALDVFAEEPPSPGNPLIASEHLTVSPHAAGLTRECAERMAVAAVENVLDFFNGRLDAALVVNTAHVGREGLRPTAG